MAKAIIVDDERLMRDQLRGRLHEAWPELEICGEAANGKDALALVAKHTPDLAFLDIRMPGMSGLEVAREIGARCHVVFVTAYDQYAIEAFERGAIDYLLKPIERERLAVTAARQRERLAQPPLDLDALIERLTTAIKPAQSSHLQWIQARVGQNLRMIPVNEILFFHADDKYTRVVGAQYEALIKKPIKELVDELDPNEFWQIHRATLVNAKAIAAVTRDLRGRLLLSLHGHAEKLEVSRTFSHLFKQM